MCRVKLVDTKSTGSDDELSEMDENTRADVKRGAVGSTDIVNFEQSSSERGINRS